MSWGDRAAAAASWLVETGSGAPGPQGEQGRGGSGLVPPAGARLGRGPVL